MKKISINILLGLTVLAFMSCEKVIDLKVNNGKPLPYIDAWITDQPGVQTIKFLKAVDYLDKKDPAPITDAQVIVTDLTIGKSYTFTYNNGAYNYDAGANKIGFINHIYRLDIVYQGETFTADDTLKRNTKIDSITVEQKEASGGRKAGYYATFYANDLPGGVDYYWIRTYKNGSLNYYAGEMFSIDGSFNEGISDGFEFVVPFREGITSFDHPYVKGDVVKVLIRSLSKPSYEFGNLLNDQIQNGGLFATILKNVPTNVKSTQSGSANAIYGWFGTVAEVSMEKTIN